MAGWVKGDKGELAGSPTCSKNDSRARVSSLQVYRPEDSERERRGGMGGVHQLLSSRVQEFSMQ